MRSNHLMALATIVIIACGTFLLWDYHHTRAQAGLTSFDRVQME